MATKKLPPKRKIEQDKRRHIFTFWKIVGVFILLIALFFLMTAWGVFGALPDETSMENPEKNLATEIISSDGKTIGKFYKENRTPVPYDSLPAHLVNALIATEDARYYKHSGIDAKGTLRAIVYMGKRGGASTISQQLAKLFFTEQVSRNKWERAMQKVKEWIIAIRLERRYTKEEIITMYFNEYDFVNQAVGIESAAHIYFDKPPSQLNETESATLVGMFKNASLYNPLRNPQGVINRRNVVLNQMAKYGYISEVVRDSLKSEPLNIRFTPQGHDEGIATYFREYTRHFMEKWIRENPKSDGSRYNIYQDGLKVYVSINSQMQKHAEEAVQEHMKKLQVAFEQQNKNNKTAPFRKVTNAEIDGIMNAAMRKSDRWREMRDKGYEEEEIIASFHKETPMRVFSWSGSIDTVMTPIDSIRYHKSFLQASMMSMTPQTGEVKAWVGGIDYKHFKYDMVKQGKRQIGSTFKPFVYATAIDLMHMSPCDTLPNTLYTIPEGRHHLIEPWTPKNSSDTYGDMVTLKYALANSVNTITARLIDRVGPEPVIELIRKMGVDTEKIPPFPSIALGTPDISVFEMVGAYSTFANHGVYVEPVLIQRIEDKHGTVLFQNIPQTRDVISAEAAYVTVSLLEGVTQYGTGTRLRGTGRENLPVYKAAVTGYPYNFTNPIAGKTGTSQNNSDGWFMGMVPNLVTGVWVGGEDRSIHFNSTAYGQGATMALPIWGVYMKKCYEDPTLDVSKDEFPKPEYVSIETDCSKWNKEMSQREEEFSDEFNF
ncbi:MAG: penicillin-binding protein [Bacteroidetes bacterium]|nr:penicillin-binding protein [Bacteroidota bacterium]